MKILLDNDGSKGTKQGNWRGCLEWGGYQKNSLWDDTDAKDDTEWWQEVIIQRAKRVPSIEKSC